jgi:hypothetical protein
VRNFVAAVSWPFESREDWGPVRLAMKLNFKIKHIMFLIFWTALVLWIRDPLITVAPDLVTLLVWVSGIVAVGTFVGLYGVAIVAAEGDAKDRLVNQMCYVLIGDGIMFFLFSVVEARL